MLGFSNFLPEAQNMHIRFICDDELPSQQKVKEEVIKEIKQNDNKPGNLFLFFFLQRLCHIL